MSGQDFPPSQPPRRKKLVLRKIAVDGVSVPDTWSNSYTGPLPVVRPPPRPSFTSEAPRPSFTSEAPRRPSFTSEAPSARPSFTSEAPRRPSFTSEAAIRPSFTNDALRRSFTSEAPPAAPDAEPEIISEMAIESTVIVAPSPDAWAAAAMTAAVARAANVAPARAPLPSQSALLPPSPPAPPVRLPADRGSRTTVSPVVATLTPVDETAQPRFARARFSPDSKVLAAGGAMAAAMLLVALGVFLGVRSTRATASTTAATVAPTAISTYPVVVDVHAAAPAASGPPAAVDVPTVVSSATDKLEKTDAHGLKAGAAKTPGTSGVAPKSDVSLTVDVAQLPAAQTSRTRWVAITPKAPAAAGWTVPAAHANDSNPVTAGWAPTAVVAAGNAPATAASNAPAVDEIPPATPPPLDPLVQAVREDIREDEARNK